MRTKRHFPNPIEAGTDFAASCTKRKATRIGLLVASLVVLGEGAMHTAEISTVVHQPTSKERFIKDALKRTMTVLPGPLWIDCIDLSSKRADGESITVPLVSVLPIIHLDNSVCDDVITYSKLPDKSKVTPDQANSLIAVVHEGDHVRFNSVDEAATDCRALQDVPRLARALGATASEMVKVQESAVFENLHNAAEKYVTRDCHNGGPYDQDPDRVGIFPFPRAG